MHVYSPDPLSYLLAELFPLAVTAWTGYLAWRVVRAYERRSPGRDRLDSLTERVRALEDDVERTVEAQRFTTRLLLGRNGGADDDSRELASSR